MSERKMRFYGGPKDGAEVPEEHLRKGVPREITVTQMEWDAQGMTTMKQVTHVYKPTPLGVMKYEGVRDA